MPGALHDGLGGRPRAVVTLLPEGIARETLEAHGLRVGVVGRDPRIRPQPAGDGLRAPWNAWAPARTGVDGRRQYLGRGSGGRRRGRLRRRPCRGGGVRRGPPSRPGLRVTGPGPDRAPGRPARGRGLPGSEYFLSNSETRRGRQRLLPKTASGATGRRGVDVVDVTYLGQDSEVQLTDLPDGGPCRVRDGDAQRRRRRRRRDGAGAPSSACSSSAARGWSRR